MFDDLDLTLSAILRDATVPPSLATVSFLTPDKGFTPTEATLNLFLYGVHENRVLRDPVPIITEVAGAFVRRRPPLRLDCDYLVTAWSKKTDGAAVAEERLLLATALAKLSRFPTIPAGYLQNTLVGQPFPVQMWVAQSDDGKSLGEFWTALGVAPRASFHVLVTVAMDLDVRVPEGPPVLTRELDIDDDMDGSTPGEAVFAIGGVVRDPTGPVPGAVVALDGRSAVADTDGRYRITGVAAGAHVLRTTAPGHVPRQTAITVPAAALNGYDVTFPP